MRQNAAVLDSPSLPGLELKPPREAVVEGVFRQQGSVHDGRIIYTERMLDTVATKATKRIKKDAEGKELWKRAANGEPLYPMYEMDLVYRDRRYVLFADNRNRHVKRVYQFEATAEELATAAQQDAEAERSQESESYVAHQWVTSKEQVMPAAVAADDTALIDR